MYPDFYYLFLDLFFAFLNDPNAKENFLTKLALLCVAFSEEDIFINYGSKNHRNIT